jgi:hypothetical protein
VLDVVDDSQQQVAIDLVLGNVRVETLNMSLLEQEERVVASSATTSYSSGAVDEQFTLDITDDE